MSSSKSPKPPDCCGGAACGCGRCAGAAGWRAGGSYQEGSANFEAMREWNRALVYRKTIAYFADRLAAGGN